MEAAFAHLRARLIDVTTFEASGTARERADLQPGRQQVLQRRHFRRLRRSAAPAVQRRQQLVPDARRPQPQRQGRLRLPEHGVGRAVQLSRTAQFYVAESLQPGDRRLGAAVARATTMPGASISKGKIYALFARDKFEVTEPALRRGRPALGAADRDERHRRRHGRHQRDRAAAVGQLRPDRRRQDLVTGSYGRYYASIIQGFSDAFAERAAAGQLRQLRLERQQLRVPEQRPRRRLELPAEPRPQAVPTWTSSRSASSASSAATWAPACASSTASGAT